MSKVKGYSVTPQSQVGQHGAPWIRWLDRYAADHATTMAQIAVRDFPPLVREQITQEADGETMTPSTMQLIVTVIARLGAAHGLRQVPFTLEDIVALTQALVLDNALTTLHTDAVIGNFHVDDAATGPAGVLGDALARWLAARPAAPSAPLPTKRRR
jgi:hypothetical protein